MSTDTASQVEQAREAKRDELAELARHHLVVADALEAIVTVLHTTPVPVAHYEQVWFKVADELTASAREARIRARYAAERVPDIEVAIDARARFGR